MGEHPHDKTSAGDKHDEMMSGHTHAGSEKGKDGVGREGSPKGKKDVDDAPAKNAKPGKGGGDSKGVPSMGYDR